MVIRRLAELWRVFESREPAWYQGGTHTEHKCLIYCIHCQRINFKLFLLLHLCTFENRQIQKTKLSAMAQNTINIYSSNLRNYCNFLHRLIYRCSVLIHMLLSHSSKQICLQPLLSDTEAFLALLYRPRTEYPLYLLLNCETTDGM